jgi:glycine/serine hydroxymethyltransferase
LHPAAILTEHYETLRSYVLARNSSSGLRLGQGALMARGMAAWMQVAGELIAPVRSALVFSREAASVPQLVQDEVIQLMGAAVMTLVSGGSL